MSATFYQKVGETWAADSSRDWGDYQGSAESWGGAEEFHLRIRSLNFLHHLFVVLPCTSAPELVFLQGEDDLASAVAAGASYSAQTEEEDWEILWPEHFLPCLNLCVTWSLESERPDFMWPKEREPGIVVNQSYLQSLPLKGYYGDLYPWIDEQKESFKLW